MLKTLQSRSVLSLLTILCLLLALNTIQAQETADPATPVPTETEAPTATEVPPTDAPTATPLPTEVPPTVVPTAGPEDTVPQPEVVSPEEPVEATAEVTAAPVGEETLVEATAEATAEPTAADVPTEAPVLAETPAEVTAEPQPATPDVDPNTGNTLATLTQVACNDDANKNTLTSSLTLNGLLAGVTYHIQIGGYQADYGDYAISIEQIGVPKAATPRLTTPPNNVPLTDQTPDLSWNAANNAVDYVIQIARDRKFNDVLVEDTTTATTFAPSGDLPEGDYYWRVAGINATGLTGRFSGARRFSIDLTPPQASDPVDKTVTTTRPAFRVTNYGRGASYEIQLSDTNNFSGDLDFSFTCNRTRCTPDDALHQGEWHWRVRALDALGNPTAFSAAAAFTIDLLKSPNDEAIITTRDATGSVKFNWRSAAGATGYTLQVDDDAAFGSVDHTIVTTRTSETVSGLAYGTYYWRVLATGLDTDPSWVPSRAVIVSPQPPAAPVLLFPARNGTTADQTPHLDWEAVSGTDITYVVRICTRGSCRPDSTIIESADGLTASEYTVTTTLDTRSDGASQNYYWQVAAVNQFGALGRFTTWRFSVRTQPPQPTAPKDESSLSDPTPTLRWKAYPGATYDLQIDDTDNFASPIVDDTGLTGTTYTLLSDLPEGTYFWHVRAVDGTPDATLTDYSATFSFTIGPKPPAAPRPTAPRNNATLADATPELAWDPVTDATTYCVQLAGDARFRTLVIADECGLVDTAYTLTTFLADGRYYWRVRAVNDLGGPGNWSRTQKVSVQLMGPEPRRPKDASTTRDATPTLQWQTYPGAVEYYIRIDDEAACDSSLDDFTSTSSRFTTPVLDQGTYYWCVQAVDYLNGPASESAFGAVSSFTVNLLNSPRDGSVTGDTTPALRWQSAVRDAQYCLDVDDEDDFASPVYTTCGLTSNNLTLPEQPYGIYYWRVRVSTDNGSTYTPAAPPYFMLTISPKAPTPPRLQLPTNRAIIWTTEPDLTWQPSRSGDPETYAVEVATDRRFNTIVWDETLAASSCSADACTVSVDPLTNGEYYWRVRAVNEHAVASRNSAAFRFTVTDPTTPTLKSPADNSNTTSDRPTFKWNKLRGAVTYDVRLATDNPPATVVAEDLTRTAYRPDSPLLVATYYWQVQAYDSVGTPSGWSAVWVVKIVSPTNGVPLLNRFGPGSTEDPHTVIITWGPISWTAPAGWYEVEIDSSQSFKDPLYASPTDASLLPTGTQELLEGDLPAPLPNGIYYWRVRACDGTGDCGAWSSIGSFVVDR